MNSFKISGKIVDSDENPVAHALVRFISELETLGGTSRAVVSARTAVVWTEQVTGFGGHRWNAYRKFVAGKVAGITFAEFKQQVVEHNPALTQDADVFQTDGRYLLPRNDPASLEIDWDRGLTGFAGNRWQCWNTFVAGKVIGLSWDMFKAAVIEQNPSLIADNYIFQSGGRYRLPHHRNLSEYEVTATSSSIGRYVMPDLPAGKYRVEVMIDGRLRTVETLTVDQDTRHDILVFLPSMAAAAAPDGFVSCAQGEFRLNGQGFGRFVGVNLPHFLHYGDTGILQFSQDKHQREMLEKAREVKARVIRTFLPHHKVTTEVVLDRLRIALKWMETFDMYLLPVFIDQYSNSGAFPNTTDLTKDYQDFRDNSGHSVRLSDAFFRDRYQHFYLDFVETVVKEFTHHKRVFAWEIGNELKSESLLEVPQPNGTVTFGVRGNPDQFVAFNLDVASQIKAWDGGRHMVTTGMLCSRQAHMEPRPDLVRKLYGTHESPIDFITVHAYEEGADKDAVWAFQFNRPVLVEEAGIARNLDDFSGQLNRDLKRWFDDSEFTPPGPNAQAMTRQHAAGYMLWHFDPLHFGEGGGDFHEDFNTIRDQFARFV